MIALLSSLLLGAALSAVAVHLAWRRRHERLLREKVMLAIHGNVEGRSDFLRQYQRICDQRNDLQKEVATLHARIAKLQK